MRSTNVKIICIIFVVLIFILTIVIGTEFSNAASEIEKWGGNMSELRSQSGNSVAEAYYQYHGRIYIGQSKLITAIGSIICVLGIAGTGAILWSALKKKTASVTTDAIASQNVQANCPQCGEVIVASSHFCTKCGYKLANKTDIL